MRHLDEHTIAYYAMGAELPSTEKEAIESHLNECHGCRAQVEELRGIDRDVAEAINSGESPEDLPSDALVRLPRVLAKRPDAPPVRLEPRSLSKRGRLLMLVRRHPVGTGSAGLMLALLLFLSINTVSTWFHKTDQVAEQPLFVKTNSLGTVVEVYGRQSKIFDIPIYLPAASPKELERSRILLTRMVDLDGDGNEEVINGSPHLEDGREVWNELRIYSNVGRLLHTWPLGAPVRYNGVDYASSYGITGVIISQSINPPRKEIIVGINNDRSPWCLMRLDVAGKILGEYWHFGWLNWLTTMRLDGIDHEVIAAGGENDQDYRSNNVYPMLTILDPARIVGKTESECTRGFGLPASDAELYYIRSGNVNPGLISGPKVEHPSFGYYLKLSPDSSLDVSQGFSIPQDFPGVVYTFGRQLALKDVWMADGPRLDLMQKYLINKTPAGFNEFTDDLRKKVRYWDGSRWKKEPTRIVHTSPPG